jgi:hypothetical protein
VTLEALSPMAEANPLPQVVAAKATVSGIEARKADGSWVPSESDPSDVFDLAALGGGAMLSPHPFPEGKYGAIQIRFSRVDLALRDGTHVPLTAPPTGWTVVVPADFSVVAGHATVVGLTMRPGDAFKLGGGQFAFEPEIVFDRVLHD